MRLTITNLSDDLSTLEVSDDMELENFKALCEFETGVPVGEMIVVWNGQPLIEDKKKLKDYGLVDGEMLLVQKKPRTANRGPGESAGPAGLGIDFGDIQIPGGSGATASSPQRSGQTGRSMPDDPETIRQMLLSSPHDVAILKERNPPLAEALLSGNLEKFTQVLRKQQAERSDREKERMKMLTADPFDAEVQKQIAEEIRMKNVETNMETAMEYSPESFGQVVMLYIDCQVNGHPVKAFVDSGAQMTIMSQRCAERCNIRRLVDTRWAGIAKGVGTQQIIGRVHLGQIQIGKDYLQSSFSILEEQSMDMLLGLDMLKRHQCLIDLKQNCLVIGTTGTVTPFLGEGDLPDHARLNKDPASHSADEDRQLAEALAKSAEESGTSGKSSGASTSSTPSTAQEQKFAESDIEKLTKHGFTRQRVIEELTLAKGNVDQALAALFVKSFQFP